MSVANFKSWRAVERMRLAPITGLFGTNSSGKTSLLQLLLLLKQTVNSSDRLVPLDFGDERSLVTLGTLRDVLFQHDERLPLSWELQWDLPHELAITDPSSGGSLFTVHELGFGAKVRMDDDQRKPTVMELHYDVGEARFWYHRSRGAGGYHLDVGPEDAFVLQRSVGRPLMLPAPVKCYGFPDQVQASFRNVDFLADLVLEFENLFHAIHYLGPLREYPRRQYTWGGTEPQDVGMRGERVVDALLAARSRGRDISPGHRKRKRSLEEYVAGHLRDLGLISSFSVDEVGEGTNLYQVRVRKTLGSTPVLLTDVGFGVSQILPVIVLCYYAPPRSILILEQPEIHLHPAVQAGLADVLIDAITVRDVQIIVESHSEHLLQRLQRRVAEGTLAPEKLALHFCDVEAGRSRLTPLDVNDLGFITNWPEGFFGDPVREAMAMTLAAQERKGQRSA
ncbi:MAG: AAA family ATPase [Egibacteraceae bacterium]